MHRYVSCGRQLFLVLLVFRVIGAFVLFEVMDGGRIDRFWGAVFNQADQAILMGMIFSLLVILMGFWQSRDKVGHAIKNDVPRDLRLDEREAFEAWLAQDEARRYLTRAEQLTNFRSTQ